MKHKMVYFFVMLVVFCLTFSLWKAKAPKRPKLNLHVGSFSELPGWKQVDARTSLLAFQISCTAFLKQNPEKLVGSDVVNLKALDWQPACVDAQSLKNPSRSAAKAFFEKWFLPVEFVQGKRLQGLFTGYYMPRLKGSLKKSKKYHVPLYGLPTNLVTVDLSLFDPNLKHRPLVGRVEDGKLLPYYTRAEINLGLIKDAAPVVAWVDNTIDRSFLEIQGSGIIDLKGGGELVVGYIAANGQPYTAIAKVLINKGVMTLENASMQHIRRYLEANPSQIDQVLNENKSFVFFNALKQNAALGSQGVVLTPGYSLAVDKQWVPLGTPIWLSTTHPDEITDENKVLQRLMIAQDTGGAIKGKVRGDVYWGAGDTATAIAGKMKNMGHYWMLLPVRTLNKSYVPEPNPNPPSVEPNI
ncbi:MAG: MltA domain-containing protein [Legionellales bacterium]|nr:MltA domain-containing protein [Legionellales bacterium]